MNEEIVFLTSEPTVGNLYRYIAKAPFSRNGGDENLIRRALSRYDPTALTTALAFMADQVNADKLTQVGRSPTSRVYTLARVLIEEGADPEDTDGSGRTPEEHDIDSRGVMGPLGHYIRKIRLNRNPARFTPDYYPQERMMQTVRRGDYPEWKSPRYFEGNDWASGSYVTPRTGRMDE